MSLIELQTIKNPFITPGDFTDTELPVAQLIQRRRLQMLVHSRLYYVLDRSIITDQQWSMWARQLAELQNKHPEIASRVCYASAFEGWDGSSGAFLPLEDPWVVNKVNEMLNDYKRGSYKIEHKKVFKSTGVQGSKSVERKTPSELRSKSVRKGRCSLF